MIADHYNNALVYLDATGLGDPIADDLLRAGVSVEPVKFTEMIKKELVEKLSIFIEQKRISMIPIKETMHEFDNFSYHLTHSGKIRYEALSGQHDDIVIAHALAISGLYELMEDTRKLIKVSPIQRLKQRLLYRQRPEVQLDEEWREFEGTIDW